MVGGWTQNIRFNKARLAAVMKQTPVDALAINAFVRIPLTVENADPERAFADLERNLLSFEKKPQANAELATTADVDLMGGESG